MNALKADEKGLGIGAFGVFAIVVGAVGLTALLRVEPSLRWAWRHQQPWWVIGLGGLWIAGGIALLLLHRRPAASATVLAVLALSTPLALGAEVDRSNLAYAFSDYRFWWLGDRWVLGWLDFASAVAAFLAGWIVGRLPPVPAHRRAAGILALLVALVALVITTIAIVTFALVGMAGEERTQVQLYVRYLGWAEGALAVAGASLAYVFARRP